MLQPPLPAHLREDGGVGGEERASMGSRISGFLHGAGGGSGGKHNNGDDAKAKDKKKKKKRRRGKPTDEFEMDLESQSSNSLGSKFYGSSKERDGETKLPGTTRTVIKLLSISFKCVIWALTLVFKALYKVVVGLSKCLASEKL
ncbi:putative acetylserotonin methytransferase-like protein [Eutypa lata UCREL1]|uniref:Putative acetylserotonin methytransferase-like protein n=1 Tax=Eutypa lata (strain UCR-EL1) TaxID=1287681 RepID=M7TS24_EUTLA|nr:putative acetylserotonin methytransferase-like protein [Eutypa lata UCREL1]